MKYTVKCQRSIDRMSDEDLLYTLLELRGVENPGELLAIDNGAKACLWDTYRFKNMQTGLELLKGHLDSGSPICVFFDSDCFTGDTKIKMLDGTIKSFEELHNHCLENGYDDVWVYSCDEKGNIKPGKVTGTIIKGKTKELCIVTLDNGEKIKCTPNHRFMLKDGTYKEAQYLSPTDSLMPLYTRIDVPKDRPTSWPSSKNGYESVLCGDSSWKLVHRIVAEEVLGEKPYQYHTHHINFNSRDNRPSNLAYLTKGEHMGIHARESNMIKNYNGSQKQKDDVRKARAAGRYKAADERLKAYNKTEANSLSTARMNQRDDIKILQQRAAIAKTGKFILELGYSLTEENIRNKPWQNDSRWPKIKNGKNNKSPRLEIILKYFKSFDEFKECAEKYNHKVISVEIIELEEEVLLYDMEVEKWHNFALACEDGSGVFVHNCDGISAGAEVYLWLQHYFPHIELSFIANEGKKHGLNPDVIARIPENAQLIIIPDSSSSDVQEHIELWEDGLDIIILDHHEFDIEAETPACIINCMDGQYPNTSLTGSTVVHKFLQLYEQTYFNEYNGYSKELLPLAALGSIADLADVRELETRYLCLEGCKTFNTSNLFLQAVMEEQEYSMKGVANFVTVGWYVSPLINAIFRAGTLEDRYDLFRAMCNFEETRVHIPKRKTKDNPDKLPVEESLQKNVIRRAKSIKTQQDNEVKKEVKMLTEIIEKDGCINDAVIIIDVTDKIEKTHGGLIANKLCNQYMKPVLLINGNGGSARNYSKFPVENLNEWLTSSCMVTCHGHSNAFGLGIEDKTETFTQDLKAWCNQQLDGVDISPIWHVDFEFDIAKLKPRHIIKVGQLDSSWGGKNMDAPLFAIKNVELETADVQRLGQSGTLMKFDVASGEENITFVRAFTGQEVYKDFVCEEVKSGRGLNTSGSAGNKKINATIIGKFTINEFAGKQFPQIEIVEFETTVASGGRRRTRGF